MGGGGVGGKVGRYSYAYANVCFFFFLLCLFFLQVRLRAGGDCEECSVMVHVSGGVYHVLKPGTLLCHGRGGSILPVVVREGSVFDSLPFRGCENKLMVFGVCSLSAREYFVKTDDPGLDSLLVRREYRTSNLSHISPSLSEHNRYGLRLKHELAQAQGDLSTLSSISTESLHHQRLQLASGGAWLLAISFVLLIIVSLIGYNVCRARRGVACMS